MRAFSGGRYCLKPTGDLRSDSADVMKRMTAGVSGLFGYKSISWPPKVCARHSLLQATAPASLRPSVKVLHEFYGKVCHDLVTVGRNCSCHDVGKCSIM